MKTTTAKRIVPMELPPGLLLKSGGHKSFEEGACVMEAVAFVAREKFSDSPACACPVVSAFVRRFNDRLPNDEIRTRLLMPLVPRLVGSKSTRAVEEKRAWLLVDWSVRVFAPTWLELANLGEAAAELRALPPLTKKNQEATRLVTEKVRGIASDKRADARKKLKADVTAAVQKHGLNADAADAAAAYAAAAAADAAYAAADAADAAYAAADAAYAYAYAYAKTNPSAPFDWYEWRKAFYEKFRERADTALAPTIERTRQSAVEAVVAALAIKK